ncbi:hypothetical protein FOFC_21522 [Fusarium oxysporum]|nr:hypothetical protein FOFC_21522 [Fusarium oxysporum]
MLIARVHVFVNVMQVRGQQYKYRGHIVHFLRDVGKVYSQLPLLPPELDVILLRPPTASEHATLTANSDASSAYAVVASRSGLNFLSNNHPGYRGITVCQKRMSVLPEDGDVLDQVATAAVTDPLSANLGNIENDDVEPDEVDQSAVPDLLPEDTEMEALRSHVLGEERGEHLPVRPSTQHQLEMPDIRRTPINEFNHSQALLSLAFPTLFPRGQADFVEPRLRPIKYADYIQHAFDGMMADLPVIPHSAWHFYRRFGLFRDIVLKQKFNVTDYWNRYEWQGRGSSHCHGLFWMDGAPSVDLENEHLRKEFARIWRFHVTAFNPEPARVRQQGEEVRDTLNSEQRIVYDTFIGHFQCGSEEQILLHVDGYRDRQVLHGQSPVFASSETRWAFNHTVFLKKVQRQGDDQAGFRLALEELRGLKLSIESWKLLSQRVQVKLSQREEDTFDAALRIYSKKLVNEYNYEHLVRLKHPAIQVMAKNIGNGADKATSEQAGNLAGQFPVCIGARLMLTQNIWQQQA